MHNRQAVLAVDAIDQETSNVAKGWEHMAALQEALDAEEAASELSPEEQQRRARTATAALPAIAEAAKFSNPFPALEIMKIGREFETFQMETRFQEAKRQGRECTSKIETLLKFSPLVNALSSDADSHPLTDEMKTLILALRDKEIDLLPGELNGRELKKDDLISIKSLVGYHIDMQRSKMTEIFSSDVSLAVEFLRVLADMMKAISKDFEKGGATFTRNQRPGG